VYLTGVNLMGVYLTGLHFMGVYLTGMYLGTSQATQFDSLSVGDTIRLYAAMIGYGYECMRTPL
jgi:hypothetical protein